LSNVIKLRCRAKNQEKEQVIEKIARSFFARKKKNRTDDFDMLGGE
jgi:hypothetical protein